MRPGWIGSPPPAGGGGGGGAGARGPRGGRGGGGGGGGGGREGAGVVGETWTTIKTEAGRSAGRPRTNSVSACTPPALAPTTMMSRLGKGPLRSVTGASRRHARQRAESVPRQARRWHGEYFANPRSRRRVGRA